jgi:hypothetical protein
LTRVGYRLYFALMNQQTFIVTLRPELARRVRQVLDEEPSGYSSVNEFIEVALENQLGLEASALPAVSAAGRRVANSDPAEKPKSVLPDMQVEPEDVAYLSTLLQRPAVAAPLPLVDEGLRKGVLSTFTNRLSPIKVAARVLANMSVADSEWPTIARFRQDAAEAARYLGVHLLEADGKVPAGIRRSVAYPIGPDAEKAKTRFTNSFTLTETDGIATGPMVSLGLANLLEGRTALTRSGWRLAAAPSPLIESSAGITLSPAEAEILRAQIKQSTDEVVAVREFLDLVRQSRGRQEQLDEMLSEEHPDWTRKFLIAHRSAMLGRLSDLSALQVTGRGVSATIKLLDSASQFDVQ